MLELLLDLEELGVLLRHREKEARIVDRDRGLRGEGGQDDGVVIAEQPGLLVEDLDDADGASQVVLHRDGEDRPRAVPRGHVPFGVEARVLVGIVDEERLARVGDVARDALPDLEANRSDLVALDDARDELVLAVVEEVERGAIGLDGVDDLREDEVEELVEIERGPEGEADLAQRDADPALATELLLHEGELVL